MAIVSPNKSWNERKNFQWTSNITRWIWSIASTRIDFHRLLLRISFQLRRISECILWFDEWHNPPHFAFQAFLYDFWIQITSNTVYPDIRDIRSTAHQPKKIESSPYLPPFTFSLLHTFFVNAFVMRFRSDRTITIAADIGSSLKWNNFSLCVRVSICWFEGRAQQYVRISQFFNYCLVLSELHQNLKTCVCTKYDRTNICSRFFFWSPENTLRCAQISMHSCAK